MVYVTGDTHGEKSLITSSEVNRLKRGDTLIVLGDFGFVWDGSVREQKFLKYLGKRRYNVCFIDGTHENYDLLYKYPKTVWNGGEVRRISGTCFHLERGQIFEIDGLKIFTFGGGESYDKEMRLEHTAWWREELPTTEELESGARLIDESGANVNVILTHEPPTKIKSSLLFRTRKEERITLLNAYFEELNVCCKFNKWYFGSCHIDKTVTPFHVSVFHKVIRLDEAELGIQIEAKKKKKRWRG